jgi:CHAD domain-containing protein
MAGTGSIERELKIDADPDLQLPDLTHLADRVVRRQPERLVAAYFDTPDHRLWEQGITLRHRAGDEPHLTWTMKLDAPDGRSAVTLDRVELSWPGERESMPEEVVLLLRGIVRRAPLGQVVEVDTTRSPVAFYDREGSLCGELDDDLVVVHGGPRDGLRFRQIEFEVGPGDRRTTARIVRRLRRCGGKVNNEAKLARALGLRPAGSAARALGPGARLADVVSVTIAHAVDTLLEHDQRFRRLPSDPSIEDVHQARVAVRRLRSDLKTLATVLDPLWLRHLRSELRWLGEVLGHVRDVDVLFDHFSRHLPKAAIEVEGSQELLAALAEQRRSGIVALEAALDSDRYLNLLDRLYAARRSPPFLGAPGNRTAPGGARRRASRGLPPLVRRQWRTLDKLVCRAGNDPSDGDLHQIRIAAKQLRYASEAAAPVMGKAARRMARSAKSLQEILGDQHDAVVADAWLAEQAARCSPAGAFTAGRWSSRQDAPQHQAGHAWRPVWHRLNDDCRTAWQRQ